MSEVLEPWSHPWHALQRTLAKAVGADVTAQPQPANRAPSAARPAANAATFPAATAASWLVRARSAAAPAALSAPR